MKMSESSLADIISNSSLLRLNTITASYPAFWAFLTLSSNEQLYLKFYTIKFGLLSDSFCKILPRDHGCPFWFFTKDCNILWRWRYVFASIFRIRANGQHFQAIYWETGPEICSQTTEFFDNLKFTIKLCEFVLNMTSLWEYDFSDMIIKTRVLIAFLVNFKSRNLVWILT